MSIPSQWVVKPSDPGRIQALSREAGINPLLAQLLLNRGVTDAAGARAYLELRRTDLLDPERLPGVAEAADRLVAAIRAGRKIVVYGDYDVDGVCGTTILWSCLKLAGARDPEFHIPHRVEEGYGLNADSLTRLRQERGAHVVVTVDCGITAVKEAQHARELGLELIVTDHHTPGLELPDAAALVHPALPGGGYPFPWLCGCGVAFKLAWQIAKGFGDGKKASPALRDFLVEAMTLVALATVADVVPIQGENRVFVSFGLAAMGQGPSPGLRALLEVSNCLGKRLNTGHLGFQLGPRINAAGRLARAQAAVELLTTRDRERASALATELDECNKKRQELEQLIVAEAREMVEAAGGISGRGAVVLGHRQWHPGVVGIVAGRLAEFYHRPTIVIALGDELGQGSARSITGFNVVEAIRACSDKLVGFGGHPAAAGIRIRPGDLESFAKRFDEHCNSLLGDEHRRRRIDVEAEVRLGQLTMPTVEEIARLEPHGFGNPRPLLMAEGVRLAAPPKVVGARQTTVQVKFQQGDVVLKGVAFNMVDRLASLVPGTECALVFQPSINEWNERREVQLEVKDLRVSEEETRHAKPA